MSSAVTDQRPPVRRLWTPRLVATLALFVVTYLLSPGVIRAEKTPAGLSDHSKRLEWRKVAVSPAMGRTLEGLAADFS